MESIRLELNAQGPSPGACAHAQIFMVMFDYSELGFGLATGLELQGSIFGRWKRLGTRIT